MSDRPVVNEQHKESHFLKKYVFSSGTSLVSLLSPMFELGCDFFESKTNTQIRKRTLRNIFFQMISSVILS